MKISALKKTSKFSVRRLIENLLVFLVLILLLFWKRIFPPANELELDGSNLVEVFSYTFNCLIFFTLLLKINTDFDKINFAVSALILVSIVSLLLYVLIFEPAFAVFPYAALALNVVAFLINLSNDHAKLKSL